ncbi:phosphonate ABC transporter, permease protein PhnE [uncultured Roseibium sp.]|uniref:phosphonate ABC transporter, permease protein PhnE n=1 Tax=uncultured Roseibium sp. TaxID=1936171 RepID=UPI003216E0EB
MAVDTLGHGFDPAEVFRTIRRRTAFTVAVPLLVLVYLAYTWFAFDVPGILERAQPERAAILATDSVAYKVHVTKDIRRGGLEVAIEGERTATYDNAEAPDWVKIDGDDAVIDLGDGYIVDISGKTMHFTVPGYGVITTTATKKGVETELPPGDVPDWIKDDPRKFDARPTLDRRVQVTKTKIEVHNYFGGWENFWFTFSSPLHGKSFGELVSLARSDQRIDPEQSNLSFIVDQFLSNTDWQHGEVFIALFETIMMAVLGTLTAAIFGLPLAFLAARNFTPSFILRFGVRRLFDFLRGIDMLIWSLIFIRAFGLGPLTGALAIAFTDTGSLGKLFSEALENIDNKQVEGVRATGASQIQRYRYGVIPQILPVFVSQVLYYLESNTRSATVIGALGAGGIGLMLVETMRTSRDWENTSYIIILTILVVIVMDQMSSWLRRKLIEGK